MCLARGDAVVCVPVYNAYDEFAQCLNAVVRHTPPDVPILVADDASPDTAIRELVERVAEARPLVYLRQPENVGFVHNLNDVFSAARPADVVILNSDCVVAEGWFSGLRDAAYSDTRVATATALTNSGTILSVPNRNHPSPQLPQDWSLADAAAAVAAEAPRLRPAIPTAIGHCVYIRRSALDLAGAFDEAFAPGYEEEVEFSQRCVAAGLSHVVADDVLVEHHGGASFLERRGILAEHHEIIQARYPYFDAWVEEVADGRDTPLARSLNAAQRALGGLSVTIDGLILTQFPTGTQVHVLELIAALHAHGGLRLRVLVPPDLGDYAAAVLKELDSVEVLALEDLETVEPTDVVHRPYQVSRPSDLEVLEKLGDRLVVTHQDLIGYHNPSYHPSFNVWRSFRRLTRLALARADQVAFFSRHAANDARAAELVDHDRARVVYLGTDHRLAGLVPQAAEPRGAERIGDRPFLLYLGTDFRHKNRLFALRLLEALRERHGWPGCLVLAGPRAARGSSVGDEAAWLGERPELAEHIVTLAATNEAGKRWLLERTAAVVYPTIHEGFGLIPFEAAEADTPCLFAPETSLGELFEDSLALLVPWDEEASADRVLDVLSDGEARDALVAGLRQTAARLTWRRTAAQLVELYRDAVRSEPREASRLAVEQLHAEAHTLAAIQLEETYGRVIADAVSADLVGEHGIPVELRRPMLAVVNRRWLRAPIFGTMLLLYRLGYLLRHGRLRPRAAQE